MDLPQLEECLEVTEFQGRKPLSTTSVSLEAEIPEALYDGMKSFIKTNPHWDQYKLMSSALANFLFQNGCDDRAVTERYLNDLFNRFDS